MSIGQDREENESWDRFWGSGSVEDYLRYRNCRREDAGGDEAYCGEEGRNFPEEKEKFT